MSEEEASGCQSSHAMISVLSAIKSKPQRIIECPDRGSVNHPVLLSLTEAIVPADLLTERYANQDVDR